MEIINLAVMLILLVAMILDLKVKAVPSVLLSGLLLVVAITNPQNIPFGLLALAYAWFLMDAEFIGGMADVKVMGIIGLFIPNLYFFLVFMLMVVVAGTGYKLAIHFIMKKPERDLIPFLPALVLVYIAMIELTVGWI